MEAVDKQELQERVKGGLEKVAETMKVFAESPSKASDSFQNLNEALHNSKLGKEAQQKLAHKKEEIVHYATQTFGMPESEILPYLTDEIVLQALCYDFSPQTVIEQLIRDINLKKAVGKYTTAYINQSLKGAGLI